jgi:hypothetical protein
VELDGAQHLADAIAYRRDRRKDRPGARRLEFDGRTVIRLSLGFFWPSKQASNGHQLDCF